MDEGTTTLDAHHVAPTGTSGGLLFASMPSDAPLQPACRERELRWLLSSLLCAKFQAAHIVGLIRVFGSLDAAMQQPIERLVALRAINRPKLQAMRECFESDAPDRELVAVHRAGAALVALNDDDFPRALAALDDPPPLLWVQGALKACDARAIGIVGAREADQYGMRVALELAGQFARQGVTVVSGLARGIDSAAHRGALDGGGRTLAVIGSGLNQLYPPDNKVLADDIARSGAIISEFPMDTPARPRNFPLRNRVISGLSAGLVVAQAGLRSGSLITARLAREQGRKVFAVPGRMDDERARGCHALIREGATLTCSAADVISELPALHDSSQGVTSTDLRHEAPAAQPVLSAPPPRARSAMADLSGLSELEASILKQLSPGEAHNIESLAIELELPASRLSAGLMQLEMRGLIASLPGRNYQLAS